MVVIGVQLQQAMLVLLVVLVVVGLVGEAIQQELMVDQEILHQFLHLKEIMVDQEVLIILLGEVVVEAEELLL